MIEIEHRLERWSSILDETLGLSEIPLRRLAGNVARLSDILVGKEGPMRYLQDEDLLKAYAAFYFPQGYARAFFAVRSLLELTDLGRGAGRLGVLDAGSGIGASLLAACEAIGQRGIPFGAEGIEIVESAAGFSRRLVEKAGLQGKASVSCGDLAGVKGDRYNLILASTVLSELPGGPEAAVRHLHGMLASPGCLVVIEPSWRKGYDLVRQAARALGAGPLLPCLGAGSCSLEGKKEGWCHASLDLRLPDETLRVNQLLGHNIHYVKFTYGVFCLDVHLKRGGTMVISPPKEAKGKKLLRVCMGGRAVWLERLDRHRSESNAQLDDSACGDLVEFECRELGGGLCRIERGHAFRRLSR